LHLSACLKRDAKVLLYSLSSKFIGNFFEFHLVFSHIYDVPPSKAKPFSSRKENSLFKRGIGLSLKSEAIFFKKGELAIQKKMFQRRIGEKR